MTTTKIKSNPLDAYSSKVKRINIALPNGYEYFHSPSSESKMDARFIGRVKLIERFKNILINSQIKKGAYLVTGYRGMGKSSFVSKVIHEVRKEKKHIIELKLNLGYDILNEKDILSLIAKNVENKFTKVAANRKRISRSIILFIMTLLGLSLAYLIDFTEFDLSPKEAFAGIQGKTVTVGTLLITMFSWTYFIFKSRCSDERIRRKLKTLNANIDSALMIENTFGGNLSADFKNAKGGFSSNHKTKRDYSQFNIRQIEQELIDVLDEIDKKSSKEFIIVFDELDKIDPSTNTNLDDKKDELPGFENSSSGFKGGAITRRRKQNVLKLLSNLKFFLTTAKAKFIFITGRELYDAYLADVSDREFAISSIFHEVLYIDSFLSDSSDENKNDITSMAEHYVCQFIIPKEFIQSEDYDVLHGYTLKNYEKYLEDLLDCKQEKDKVLCLLYQFIHYLTHVSNGAPKKLTNFFEKYITKIDESQFYNQKDEFVFICPENTYGNLKSDTQYYLSFGYNDQIHIGFMHYMANPLILAIVNNVSDYGDKLLVSASFLLDHIYKFHRNGFSWRNLEHAPEILDINRTPELRSFINSILKFMKQTHISPIIAGLYMFKFPKKISEEISFVSRLNEEASAIFNFTLDESLSVKQHYIRLLEYYSKRNNTGLNGHEKRDPFIHSIAGIHHILGDLKLMDEEYTEAIFEFQDSLQSISREFLDGYKPHREAHLLFIIRTMLKMGLAFEKRKTYDSAYVTYNEIVSILIDFRYIDEDELGMGYKTESINNWQRNRAIFYHRNGDKVKDDDKFVRETSPRRQENDKDSYDYLINGDELIHNLSEITTRLKNKIITRLSLFEDVRLMYQALLAKLFLLEKNELGGITQANLKVVEGEFLNLHLATNVKEKFLISADFFRKLGDIFYYKNGMMDIKQSSFFNGLALWGYDINDLVDEYCRRNKRMDIQDALRGMKNCMILSNNGSKAGTCEETQYRNIIGKYEKNGNKKKLIYSCFYGIAKGIVKGEEFNRKTKEQPVKFGPVVKEMFKMKGKPRLPRNLTFSLLKKEIRCMEKRRILLEKRAIAPCYACKYYNRSLKILAETYITSTKVEDSQTKSLIFLEALEEPTHFYSTRNNYAQTVASGLSSMGDVMLSCTDDQDYIHNDFLKAFFSHMKGIGGEKKGKTEKLKSTISQLQTVNGRCEENNLSNLEKALLYYYTAAKFYRRSSNFKEAQMMYQKILQLFTEYVRNKKEQNIVELYLPDIRDEIVRRILQNTYAAHEHIHLPEIQKLKWNFTLQMYEMLKLNQISLYPELEESIYGYYELILLCETDQVKVKEVLNQLYGLNSFSPYRLSNSIYNRLVALRFKAIMNKHILESVFGVYSFNETPYRPIHPFVFYEEVMTLDKDSIQQYKFAANTTILEFFEHLIIDSIFCLQTFVSIVPPNSKTTLFTHSNIAAIYQDLFVWTQLFDFIFMMHAYFDDKHQPGLLKKKKQNIIRKMQVHYCKRRAAYENTDHAAFEPMGLYLAQNTFKELGSWIKREELKLGAEQFFTKLRKTIGKNNTHFTNGNYMAEMAIKRYRNSFGANSEGKPYKNMIEEMYFLNDDLDNEMFKFNLGLERYRINAGIIEEQVEKLKSIYKNAMVFDVENYIVRSSSKQ